MRKQDRQNRSNVRHTKIKKSRKSDTIYTCKGVIPANALGVPKHCYLFEAWNYLAQNNPSYSVLNDEGFSELDKPGVQRCLALSCEVFKENGKIPWAEEYGDLQKCGLFYELLTDLVVDMFESLSVSVTDFYKFSFLSDKEKYRGIGEKINKLGGFALMFEACNFLPKTFVSEIDCCWDGIGSWRW